MFQVVIAFLSWRIGSLPCRGRGVPDGDASLVPLQRRHSTVHQCRDRTGRDSRTWLSGRTRQAPGAALVGNCDSPVCRAGDPGRALSCAWMVRRAGAGAPTFLANAVTHDCGPLACDLLWLHRDPHGAHCEVPLRPAAPGLSRASRTAAAPLAEACRRPCAILSSCFAPV